MRFLQVIYDVSFLIPPLVLSSLCTVLSSYQRRLADLSAEIKSLEAENVAPKPWTLQGEASARSRPQNALLSADLEFEHVGKVVPIVTEETVKKLEDRIKARIIEVCSTTLKCWVYAFLNNYL